MSSTVFSRCRNRRICMFALSATLTVALCLMSSPAAFSQELEGTVTRDPRADLAIYTFDFTAPPELEFPVFKIALPVDPSKIAPGTIVSPVGWDAQLVVLPGSTFWGYDPQQDPKFLAGNYGPNPNAWIDPPLILWSANTDASAVMPGDVLSGFQFVSPFLPVNVPAQFQLINGQVFSIDPPSPGDQLVVPEPTTIAIVMVGFVASLFRRQREPVGFVETRL